MPAASKGCRKHYTTAPMDRPATTASDSAQICPPPGRFAQNRPKVSPSVLLPPPPFGSGVQRQAEQPPATLPSASAQICRQTAGFAQNFSPRGVRSGNQGGEGGRGGKLRCRHGISRMCANPSGFAHIRKNGKSLRELWWGFTEGDGGPWSVRGGHEGRQGR
ncbi:hypothetical protein V494_00895 [Pseudogymnoascus sp. VKM F-4513 (FW-928)]|nr:hypothetical protein V494_00895 [Pseudogymnoascus sp. VKM F-4513 (FW-928)]